MKKFCFVLAFLSTILHLGCKSESIEAENAVKVVSGSSFGFCMGYCMKEIRFNDSSTDVEIEFFNVSENMSKAYSDKFAEDDWQSILQTIDLDMFFDLKPFYGCPDCADGGAEYIEISSGVRTHRVTFEYGGEVEGIESLITLLREHRLALIQKHLPKEEEE